MSHPTDISWAPPAGTSTPWEWKPAYRIADGSRWLPVPDIMASSNDERTPEPMADKPQYFAMYVEITREITRGGAADRERRQWLVTPNPDVLAPDGGHAPYMLFWREQRHSKNRAIWRVRTDAGSANVSILGNTIAQLCKSGWSASPVVTCEVTEFELRELLREKKTPYKILERIARVAKAKHGLAI